MSKPSIITVGKLKTWLKQFSNDIPAHIVLKDIPKDSNKVCRIPGKFKHGGTETVFGDRHWSFITPGAFTLSEAKRLQDWANRLVAYLEYNKEKKRVKKEKKADVHSARREATTRKASSTIGCKEYPSHNYDWD